MPVQENIQSENDILSESSMTQYLVFGQERHNQSTQMQVKSHFLQELFMIVILSGCAMKRPSTSKQAQQKSDIEGFHFKNLNNRDIKEQYPKISNITAPLKNLNDNAKKKNRD
jgi:septal ring-binding cell division protein DamX